MATTQSIHMGPEWMRPPPASQTTINPLGKNPSLQPPPPGIVSNALRHAEGLKTSATATTGTSAERSALGSASTPQAAPANGTSSSGEWKLLLWYPRSCDYLSRVNRAGSFFGDGSPKFPHTPCLILNKEYSCGGCPQCHICELDHPASTLAILLVREAGGWRLLLPL